jgi:peptidoglycan-associated lipoprotein
MNTKQILPLAAVLALTLGACGRRAQPAPAVAPPPAAAATTTDNGEAARREAAERARLAEEARLREERARMAEILATSVYFDYDSHDIRADSRALLDSKVPVLRANPGVRLLIVGHTDERGSTEYNLALGMRRAESVREYLANLGFDRSRFDVTSFGEERPVDPGESESAWARNRRAEFEVTGALAGGS